jgi:osmotically-inducible protein OsmY
VAPIHRSNNALVLICASVLIVGAATACENTARGIKQDAKQAESGTRDERADAKAKASELKDNVAHATERAAGAAAQAGEEIAERASAVKETIDVKASLMADPSVDATRLNVDTDYRTRTITLKGFVPSDAERSAAEAIAKARAPGYTVVNNLVVKPRN